MDIKISQMINRGSQPCMWQPGSARPPALQLAGFFRLRSLRRSCFASARCLPDFRSCIVPFRDCAEVSGTSVLAGSLRLMQQSNVELPQELFSDLEHCRDSSAVIVAEGGRAVLLLAIADALKPDARDSVRELKALGVRHFIMLTGDGAGTAEAVAEQLGIDEVYAELLPQDKLEKIRAMQAEHRVVTFVGDGITDTPSITAADTGIAMGSGTDAAIDCSDVVLIKSDLGSVALALRLAKKITAVMYENIAIAIATVLLLLAGLFAGYIHMSVGMPVHETSILIVILNAMRILL